MDSAMFRTWRKCRRRLDRMYSRKPCRNCSDMANLVQYLANLLDDSIEAVFLAEGDTGFLTQSRRDELRNNQRAARFYAGVRIGLESEGLI